MEAITAAQAAEQTKSIQRLIETTRDAISAFGKEIEEAKGELAYSEEQTSEIRDIARLFAQLVVQMQIGIIGDNQKI